MAIKQVPVPGAKKDSYNATMPSISCDTPGCKAQVDGNPGSGGHESVKAAAFDRGFKTDPRTSKHYCPDHVIPTSPSGPTGSSISKAMEASMAMKRQKASRIASSGA